MIRVNLLPWREELRKRHARDFGVIVAAAVIVTLMIAFGSHIYFQGVIENQQLRNRYLESEIAALDKKIKEIKDLEKKKQSLIARMNIIQQLQQSRPEIVHLFDELVHVLPQGVFYTKLVQDHRKITVDGAAESNARVSAFMRNIESSQWIGNPSLKIIATGTTPSVTKIMEPKRFNLVTTQTSQVKKDEGDKG